ncbi:MAG: FeoB-associated Cys-rich membrane protein [Flavobacteriaceae bacterium]|nr:FeoB-associated Cys-rich membrane protein [Flavobacteriaceae bacterium]
MVSFQDIFVYVALGLALFFLIRKYLLPKRMQAKNKQGAHSCDNDECGCH